MKKLLLLSCFLYFFNQTQAQYLSLASEEPQELSAAALKALDWENLKLKSDLTLSEGQANQTKQVIKERYKARVLVAQMFLHEPKKKEAKIREIDSQFDGEFAEILNEKQFKKYLKLNGRESGVQPEIIVQAPQGPNFNAQIQALISKATAPVIDPSLVPRQDTTNNKLSMQADTLGEITPAGLESSPAQLAVTSTPKAVGQQISGNDLNGQKIENSGAGQKLAGTEQKLETSGNLESSGDKNESLVKPTVPTATITE